MIKILILKVMILLEGQNIKIFLQKITPQIGQKIFVIKKVEHTILWKYVINDLTEKKLLELLTKGKPKKTNLKEFRTQKTAKRKDKKLYVKWKGFNNSLNSWIDKKGKYKLMNISQKQNP